MMIMDHHEERDSKNVVEVVYLQFLIWFLLISIITAAAIMFPDCQILQLEPPVLVHRPMRRPEDALLFEKKVSYQC